MRLLFWAAAALIGYTYAAFPLLVLARARLRPRPVAAGPITPTISIIIAAHNEEAVIGEKVANLLALDYPADHVEVIVASDGSADGTVAAASAAAEQGGHDRLTVLDLPRTGKAGVLNRAVAQASGEILVFSDANSMFAADALRELVAPFADPSVGGVAGDQRYLPDGGVSGSAGGERGYWDIDRMIKQAESTGGNVISATGAIYAIRRSLFTTVPEGVTDDFATSTAVIAHGHRLVFAPGAAAYEPVGASAGVEYGRKVRVMTRGLNGVVARRSLLNPRRHGFYAVQLFSHKVLRRLMAIPLLMLLASTLRLARRSPFYALLALAQSGLYGLGAAGLALGRRPLGRHRLLALPAYFCLVNIASLQALLNVVRRRSVNRWEPRREQA